MFKYQWTTTQQLVIFKGMVGNSIYPDIKKYIKKVATSMSILENSNIFGEYSIFLAWKLKILASNWMFF